MSYLDRLKRKILEQTPECEATKGTKGAFVAPGGTYVPFVAPELAPIRQISADSLPIDTEAEVRRRHVLGMLAETPDTRYAVVVVNPDADPVRLTIGIRNIGTFEVEIQKARFDAFRLLDLIERHGIAVH